MSCEDVRRRLGEGETEMNSRKDAVAEREGVKEPHTSCFSELWLRVSPFVIS